MAPRVAVALARARAVRVRRALDAMRGPDVADRGLADAARSARAELASPVARLPILTCAGVREITRAAADAHPDGVTAGDDPQEQECGDPDGVPPSRLPRG